MKKKILIAEDEPTNFQLLKEIFGKNDITILWAKNGQEAIEMYEKNPDVNAILMDIAMPVMNGDEAAKQIKKLNENIPIIAVSAYQQNTFNNLYFDSFLEKPIYEENLMNVIEAHIRKVFDEILENEKEKSQELMESEEETVKALTGVSEILEMSDYINKAQSDAIIEKLDEIKTLLEKREEDK